MTQAPKSDHLCVCDVRSCTPSERCVMCTPFPRFKPTICIISGGNGCLRNESRQKACTIHELDSATRSLGHAPEAYEKAAESFHGIHKVQSSRMPTAVTDGSHHGPISAQRHISLCYGIPMACGESAPARAGSTCATHVGGMAARRHYRAPCPSPAFRRMALRCLAKGPRCKSDAHKQRHCAKRTVKRRTFP